MTKHPHLHLITPHLSPILLPGPAEQTTINASSVFVYTDQGDSRSTPDYRGALNTLFIHGGTHFWRSRQDPRTTHNMVSSIGSGTNAGTPAMQVSRPEASTGNAVMMPWFMDGPWIPKFSGKGGAAAFEEWRVQMEAFLRAQGLSGQRVDFVLSALEGEARVRPLAGCASTCSAETGLGPGPLQQEGSGHSVAARGAGAYLKLLLEPRWVPSPFEVLSQVRPGQPVYHIRPEGKEGPLHTLHRNNLSPCPVGLQNPLDPTANVVPESTSTGNSMPAQWPVLEVPLPIPFPDAELTMPAPSMEVASEPLLAPQEDEVSEGSMPLVRRLQRGVSSKVWTVRGVEAIT
ncbi:hypothetical protein AOLI_G00088260 [Acnodon oligacanthus]